MVKECSWCKDVRRAHEKYKLEWTVIDEDMGQPVHLNMVHYCFFCGRNLDVEEKDDLR